MENKPCRLEINATYIASQEPEKWGYTGGTVRCPIHETCKNKLAFDDEINRNNALGQAVVVESVLSEEECSICRFDDENNRTIEIKQNVTMKPKTQPEKLYDKLEEYFELKSAG